MGIPRAGSSPNETVETNLAKALQIYIETRGHGTSLHPFGMSGQSSPEESSYIELKLSNHAVTHAKLGHLVQVQISDCS